MLNDELCFVCHSRLAEVPLIAGHTHIDARRTEQPLSFFAGIIYALGTALLVVGGFRYWFFRNREES